MSSRMEIVALSVIYIVHKIFTCLLNKGADSGASSQQTDASEVAQLVHIAPRQMEPHNVLLATA